MLKHAEIARLLKYRSVAPCNDATPSSECDVVYVLFLEPSEKKGANATVLDAIATHVIKRFSPRPVMMHSEIVVPPIPDSHGRRVHFATYLGGGGAAWQNRTDVDEGIDYYLIQNGARWRALPVFGANAAELVRAACNANEHAPYSIVKYMTSARFARSLAFLWGDEPGRKGHCAIISARVLKEAGVGGALRHASSWYSPSTLYTALAGGMLPASMPIERGAAASDVAEATSTLIHSQLSCQSVNALGDARCTDAIRALTMDVCATATSGDDAAARRAQKRLASGLLRWVLLRADQARVEV